MKSELAFILDRSGSMESIRQAAIGGYLEKSLGTRAKKSGHATAEQLADADASLQQIVREEDEKRR